MLLFDRVAIVIGGAHGIGRAIVDRLAREGAKVVVADVADSEGKKFVGSITSSGREAMYRHVDITERLDVHNLVTVAIEAYGHIDILVNTSAAVDNVPFLELDEAEFDRVVQNNLKGLFLVTQAVARQMVEQREAKSDTPASSIINVSCLHAIYGFANNAAYAMSRGGQTSLTKSMALALGENKIRVNAVGAGATESSASAEGHGGVGQGLENQDVSGERIPLGCTADPADIAAAVVWLASEEAKHVNGTTLWVDGGTSAGLPRATRLAD